MMKNKTITKISLLVASFFILTTMLVGYSFWIISDKVDIKPDDKTEQVIVKYFDDQNVTYDGSIYLPSPERAGIGHGIKPEDLTYYYRNNDSQDYAKVNLDVNPPTGPRNAGTYDIKIEYKLHGDEVYIKEGLSFTINKADITLNNFVFEDQTKTYDRTNQIIEYSGSLPTGVTGVTYSGGGINVRTEPYDVTISFIIDEINYNSIEPITKKLTIVPKNLSDSSVVLNFENNNTNSFLINQLDNIASTFVVKDGTAPLVLGTDYNVTFSNTTTVGLNNTATATGIGNYTGTKTLNYDINGLELRVVEKGSSPHQTIYNYSGLNVLEYFEVKDPTGNIIPNANITYESKLKNATTYTSGLPTSVGVFNIKITATLEGYTDGTLVIEVLVNRKSIAQATVDFPTPDLTYTGSSHTPEVQSVTVDGITLDTTDYSISYENNINAGTNKAKLIITGIGNYQGTKELTFTIKQADLVLTDPVYNRTNFIQGETPSIKTQGNAKFNNQNVTVSITNNISTLTFTPSANATEDKNVTHTFTPTQNNNNGISNFKVGTTTTTVLTMYGVAYNKTKTTYYGTIEQALVSGVSGDSVWVVPEIYNNTGFYPTIKSNCEIKSGVNLILTYAKSVFDDASNTIGYRVFNDKEATDNGSLTDSSTGQPAYAKINQNITVTVRNGGNLILGGFVGNNSQVGKRGALLNHGTIELENNANIFAYGYLKGFGIVNARSGSKIYDCLRMYDFPGARYAAGMYYNSYSLLGSKTYNNIMPFNSYTVHNLSCEMNFYQGAYYYARTQMNISSQMYIKEITLMGAGGLFELTTPGGYINRTVRNTTSTADINGSYTTNNQDATQQEVYVFYSNVKDNSISIKMDLSVVTIDIATSKDLAMPVGMLDVTVTNGFNFTLNANAYKFYPGSKLTIDQGASLTVNSGVNVIFYEQYYDNFLVYNDAGNLITNNICYYAHHRSLYNADFTVKDQYKAKLVVNGSVNCLGSIGGIIESEVEGATFITSNGEARLNRLTEIRYLDTSTVTNAALTSQHFGGQVRIDVKNPMMKLLAGTTIQNSYSNVSAGTYYSIADSNSSYGWYTTELRIYYNLNGGSGDTPQPSDLKDSSNGYTITQADIPSVTTTREGYQTFGNVWSLDPEGLLIVLPGTTIIYANTTLYAVWEPIEYTITYNYMYYQSDGSISSTTPSGLEITNSNNLKYTILDSITLQTPTSNQGLVFGGWYTDSSCSMNSRIDSISYEIGDKVLYGLWYPQGTSTIIIDFDFVIDPNMTTQVPDGLRPERVVAPIVNNDLIWQPSNLGNFLDNNTSLEAYFDGWFFDSECTDPYVENITHIRELLVDGKLMIYAKIGKKTLVTIDYNGGILPAGQTGLAEGSYYYKPGYTIVLPNLTIEKLHDFTWVSSDPNVTVNGNQATLSSNPQAEITIVWNFRRMFKLTIKNVCGSSADVTPTFDGVAQTKVTIRNNGSKQWDILEGSTITVFVKVGSNQGNVIENYVMVEDYFYEINKNSGSCITETSLVNLYDGTMKMVKDITQDDLLLVYDHENGVFTYSKVIFLIHQNETARVHRVINLNFSNGKTIEIVQEHGFFDLTLNKYVYINESNIDDYINHEFVYTNDGQTYEAIKFTDYYVTEEYLKIYSPLTFKHFNCFVDGVLTVSNFTDGLYAYFEMGDNLKYDEESMNRDIETYGLFTYEELKHLGTYEEYLAFNAQYLKVAIGKGYITLEEIQRRLELFINKDNYMNNN